MYVKDHTAHLIYNDIVLIETQNCCWRLLEQSDWNVYQFIFIGFIFIWMAITT